MNGKNMKVQFLLKVYLYNMVLVHQCIVCLVWLANHRERTVISPKLRMPPTICHVIPSGLKTIFRLQTSSLRWIQKIRVSNKPYANVDVHISSCDFMRGQQGYFMGHVGIWWDMSEPKKPWLKNKNPKQGFTTEILTASLAEGAWLIRCSAWQVTCKTCRGWSWGRCKEWNFRMLKEGLALQSHRIIILKEWNSNGNLDFENIIKLFLPWWLIFSKKPWVWCLVRSGEHSGTAVGGFFPTLWFRCVENAGKRAFDPAKRLR